MAIRDILLPLVGEPSSAATAAIDKCVAVVGGHWRINQFRGGSANRFDVV